MPNTPAKAAGSEKIINSLAEGPDTDFAANASGNSFLKKLKANRNARPNEMTTAAMAPDSPNPAARKKSNKTKYVAGWPISSAYTAKSVRCDSRVAAAATFKPTTKGNANANQRRTEVRSGFSKTCSASQVEARKSALPSSKPERIPKPSDLNKTPFNPEGSLCQ